MERIKRILEEWTYPKHAAAVVSIYGVMASVGNLAFWLCGPKKKACCVCRRKEDFVAQVKKWPERMRDVPGKAWEMVEDIPDKAREMAEDIPDKAREVSRAAQRAPERISRAARKAPEQISRAARKAPKRISGAVKKMPREQKIFNGILGACFLIDMTVGYLAVREVRKRVL